MVDRTSLPRTHMTARNGASRATVRSFSDKHLMQEVEKADVFHSETPSDFERFQMVGMTSVPMKQKEEKQKQGQQEQPENGAGSGEDGMNHSQPQGEAAEAVMLYLNGQRSHPVALVDDRRVRPFNMKEGESSYYAASGTGQMLLHTDDGTYLVSLNNKPYDTSSGEGGQSGGEGEEEKQRVVSIRHVTKDKQSREIKKGQEPEDHVHEGKPDQVNTEIEFSAKNIKIRDGETVIAVYSKEDKSWKLSGFNKLDIEVDEEIHMTSPKVTIESTDEMLIECQGEFNLKGKPLHVNGGGPVIPPFTVL